MTFADLGSWLATLGATMLGPAWIAGLLQTLVAVVFAFFILNRQLRHDRNLARSQWRSDVATRAGRSLIAAHRAEWALQPRQVAALLRRSEYPPGDDEFSEGIDEAELVAGDLMNSAIREVWRQRVHSWETMRRALDSVPNFLHRKGLEHAIGLAAGWQLAASNDSAASFGQAWIKWNGVGALPMNDELISYEMDWVDMHDEKAFDDWKARVSKEFKANVVRTYKRSRRGPWD